MIWYIKWGGIEKSLPILYISVSFKKGGAFLHQSTIIGISVLVALVTWYAIVRFGKVVAIVDRIGLGISLFSVLVFLVLNVSVFDFFYYLFVMFLLVWMAYIDLKEQSVYDVHNWILICVGLIYHYMTRNIDQALWGIGIAAILMVTLKTFAWIRYRHEYKNLDYGFGDGDVFLFIALGAVLGMKVVSVLFWGPLAALVWVGGTALVKRKNPLNEFVPLVPFIAAGVYITIVISHL